MKVKSWLPLVFTLVIYWLITFALLGAALGQTHGHFGYPLDDAYIHMAIAKHYANGGVWGVSQAEFSSSSSSPLWTLLLAGVYRLVGVNDSIPLVLNFIFGNCIVVLAFFLLRKKYPPLIQSVFLFLIILFTPLPVLTLTGMEHTLHGLLTLCIIYLAATLLAAKGSNPRRFALLLLLSALVTITRYEGLFLVGVVAFLFLIAKRFYSALLEGLAGLLPIVVYGLVSMSKGWYFLPNSVLLKGNMPNFSLPGIAGFLGKLPSNLLDSTHILFLMIAFLILYLWLNGRKSLGSKEKYLIVLFLSTTLLHMQFASVGFFYRYEAYLILVGSVILLDLVCGLIPSYSAGIAQTLTVNTIVGTLLSLLLVLPLLSRAGNAIRDYPLAVKNIFEQQYQMGLFLKSYYQGKPVAVNDIGAVDYLADIKLLDLLGLGNLDVVQARQSGLFDKDKVAELVQSHGVDIVIIYNSAFIGEIPSDWVEIGRWQIADNVVCASSTVSFYAPDPSLEAETITNLQHFSGRLPATVGQSGMYVGP